MRERIFRIIEVSDGGDKASGAYDLFMMIVIVASLVPLAFKAQMPIFTVMDRIAAAVFIVDYLLRLITADLKMPARGNAAFLLYPFTPFAIIDLLSILPSLVPLNAGFRLLRIFRLLRTFRVFRSFKLLRYSKNFRMIANVFQKQRRSLSCVASLAAAYILVSALVIFNVEPDSFASFFDAIYWATVSLTTMGYGDIYPVTTIGRIVTIVSSVLGIAIVALPAGIITAGYMHELQESESSEMEE